MKRIMALLWIFGLCLGLLLYNFAITPEQAPVKPEAQKNSTSTAPSTQKPTESKPIHQPNDSAEPAEPAVQVRIRNLEPERQAAWEQITTQYSKATGVEVLILDGQSEQAPTLLTVNSLEELEGFTTHDLSATTACAQVAHMNLTLTDQGKICGIASKMSAFGLMYNVDLLVSTGYTPSDIYDLSSFSTVVQSLGQQGYTIFAGRGLTDGVAAMLASLPGNVRTLAQLFVTYTADGAQEDALERFVKGESLFYMGSTDEYKIIRADGLENIGILPIYLDDLPAQAQSLCVTAEQYWCVVGEDSAEAAATMAFLDYLVQPDENGNVPVDSLKILAPYRQATYFSNPLEQILRQDLTAGKGYLVCQPNTALPEGFMEALAAYAQNPTDENWLFVESLKK